MNPFAIHELTFSIRPILDLSHHLLSFLATIYKQYFLKINWGKLRCLFFYLPKKKKGKIDDNGIFVEPTSTYRIFSRLYCNFIMPSEIGRPLPQEDKEVAMQEDKGEEGESETEKSYRAITKQSGRIEKKDEDEEEREGDGVIEGDEVMEKMGDSNYQTRIKDAMEKLVENKAKYLSPEGLETYSPKYLRILENIEDEG